MPVPVRPQAPPLGQDSSTGGVPVPDGGEVPGVPLPIRDTGSEGDDGTDPVDDPRGGVPGGAPTGPPAQPPQAPGAPQDPPAPAPPYDPPYYGESFTFTFPISPASAASYGRTHHDYPAADIFAPCGTRVVSPIDGLVLEVSTTDRWDPYTNRGEDRGGISITLLGADGVRYYGSHLATLAPGLRSQELVTRGQTLGTVGNTGSARGTGCHLHFGISPPCGIGDWSVRRGVVLPWPYLDAWGRGEHTSPAAAIDEWRDRNPSSCTGSY